MKEKTTELDGRPPPRHALDEATGRNRRQRFWLDFAFSRLRAANLRGTMPWTEDAATPGT